MAKGKVVEIGENAEKGNERTVVLEEGKHSSAQDQVRTRKEGARGEKEESVILVKNEGPTVPVPFVQAIMDAHISEQFVPPQFKMYDGTTDPEAHIKSFTNVMAFRTGCGVVWCRAFSLSMEGEALEWFNSLTSGSIENFKSLGGMFRKKFAACSTQNVIMVDLMNLKQGRDESLKIFMD